MLGGLYLGFTGRILLKDFRDVRGDALFGKRTFLVRRGRGPTCAVSACLWTAGTCLILLTVRHLTPALLVAEAACNAAALGLLHHLARDRGPRRDELLISAIAIVGRGMIVILAAHLSMTDAGWSALRASLVIAALTAATASLVDSMLRHGPAARLTLTDGTWAWLAAGTRETAKTQEAAGSQVPAGTRKASQGQEQPPALAADGPALAATSGPATTAPGRYQRLAGRK